MKKLFPLLLTAVMLISVTACDDVGNTSDTEETTTTATTITTTATTIHTFTSDEFVDSNYNDSRITDENLVYEYDADTNGMRIIKYQGTASILSIPAEIEGYAVTVIGSKAFWGCESLENVIIPESVIVIGSFAFANCIGLIDIIIPNSVAIMGNSVFHHCMNLKSVTISSNMTEIPYETFVGCTSLTDITIPTLPKIVL